MRKRGQTYSEILSVVPVAKSTLSLWLRDCGLAEPQKQRITRARREASLRGAAAKKRQREVKQAYIIETASKEMTRLNKREFFLFGLALYWGEGSKEKSYRVSEPMKLSNMDPRLLRIYVQWLHEFLHVTPEDYYFELYLHESRAKDVGFARMYWAREMHCSLNDLKRVYYKRGNIAPKKQSHTGADYHGLLRVCVRSSTDLNRRVEGWIKGAASYYT